MMYMLKIYMHEEKEGCVTASILISFTLVGMNSTQRRPCAAGDGKYVYMYDDLVDDGINRTGDSHHWEV